MIISNYSLPFCLIETQLFGKAEPRDIPEWASLMLTKLIYRTEYYISPPILWVMNKCPHVTAHCSPIMFLYVKFLVKLHIEPGENILTQSVQLFLISLIPPCFNCIDSHQPRFSLSHWPLCWPNQSRNIWCGTHNPMLWAFRSLDVFASLFNGFIVCLIVVFTLFWIIQLTIPVQPIVGIGNTFRCAILVTFSCLIVDSSESANIQYLSSSSREVMCRQSWWQRWSFWQWICSRTSMLNIWQWCFDDLFGIWNAFYGCHLLVLSLRFYLCST